MNSTQARDLKRFLIGLDRIPSDGVILDQSAGAILWQRPDGKKVCQCPYLCDAASEPCQFRGSGWG